MNPVFLLINDANRANAIGNYPVAAECSLRALEMDPGLAEAWYQLGMARKGLGMRPQAIAAFQEALQLVPDNPDAQNTLSLEFLEMGEHEVAEKCLLQAVSTAPNFAFAHSNLGRLRQKQKRFPEAEACFRRAIELAPEVAEIYANLCGNLNSQKDFDRAKTVGLKAVRLGPQLPAAWGNLARALDSLNEYEQATLAVQRALSLDPNDVESILTFGKIKAEQGEIASALELSRRGLAIAPDDPDLHFFLSLCLLTVGDYRTGFQEYEYRWRYSDSATPPSTSLPLWRGEAIAEGLDILVYAEQGFGDSIQFSRYLPLLKSRFARVAFLCPSPLIDLFQASFGDEIMIVSACDEACQKQFHWHCPLLSLPLALGTTTDTVPSAVPYLRARVTPRPASDARIGLVWRGNKHYEGDRWRSIPFASFSPLLAMPGIQWVSLQKDPLPEECEAIPHGFHDQIMQVKDFNDTASIVNSLDLVITIDSAVAHLAGALGKPVWLLNRATSEWRWGWRQETTPWYPTMRIFNQTRLGDWTSVLDRIRTALVHEFDIEIDGPRKKPERSQT